MFTLVWHMDITHTVPIDQQAYLQDIQQWMGKKRLGSDWLQKSEDLLTVCMLMSEIIHLFVGGFPKYVLCLQINCLAFWHHQGFGSDLLCEEEWSEDGLTTNSQFCSI